MKKWGITCLLAVVLLFAACGSKQSTEIPTAAPTETPAVEPTAEPTATPTPTVKPTPTEKPTPTPLPTVAPLKDIYADNFKIGVALNSVTIGKNYKETVTRHFNSVTCENEMKTDATLDQAKSRAGVKDDPAFVATNFGRCQSIIKYCKDNNMQMRYHTLVWHAQTPDWFFRVDYDSKKDYVDAETMKMRMRNFIFQVIEYYDTNHPGLIYAIDVVNEAFNGNGKYNTTDYEDNGWYKTLGHDYVYYAFLYTREAVEASENMKDVTLVYNDYGMTGKVDRVITNLPLMFEEYGKDVHDYVDAIGMQSHLSTNDFMQNFLAAAQKFVDAGYELQLTELDIGISDNKVGEEPTKELWLRQAKKYRYIMDGLLDIQANGGKITSVTVWGFSDAHSWRGNDNGYDARALLFTKSMEEKLSLRGMARCNDIASLYDIGIKY
jgi:GH35 family endo-1,4-beta-xylanase